MSDRNPSQKDALLPLRREQPLPETQQRAAELLKQLEPVAPLSEIAVARMRRRIDAELGSAGRTRVPRWLGMVIAAAATLFFVEMAAAVMLTTWPALRHRVVTLVSGGLRSRPAAVPVPAMPEPQTPPDGLAPTQRSIPPAPGVAPTGDRLAVREVGPAGTGATTPRPRPAPVGRHSELPVGDSVGEETGVLARALAQLHARHDPEGALATFEAYGFEHPNGSLRGEAAVGQIEALLALDRNAEALALLDAMERKSFAGIPRASNLRLLRAELLGKLERCAEALPVLAAYLPASIPAAERERALLASASCRAKLQDYEGSRADLQTYLRDFPNGPYASRALMELGALH